MMKELFQFIIKALKQIKFTDSGKALRTYCYYRYIVNIVIYSKIWKKLVYNVGGESTINIADLAKIIVQTKSKILYQTMIILILEHPKM